MLIVWVIVLMISGYVGLATMSAAIALPVWIGFTLLPAEHELFMYVTMIAVFVVWWHRANIQRMRDGNEHRNYGLMILGRSRRADNRAEQDEQS